MELNELWQAALSEIELNISKASFNTWFKNSFLLKKESERVVIGCNNGFTKEWLENKYHKILVKTFRGLDNGIRTVEYTISSPVTKSPAALKKPSRPTPSIPASETQLELASLTVDKDTGLNSRYTFESFVVGANNELAHATGLAVSEKPGLHYNPFFVYGGVGLGKTHLMHAIGNAIREKFGAKRKIKYVTSEQFTQQFVNAIRKQTMEDFKNTFRSIDVFLLDDVQFLTGKDQTQEELFHTFNDLYAKNKQIIFASDRPPKAIPSLEDRLRSRFEGGMIADISLPDFETRVAILKAKAGLRQANLDPQLLELVAQKVQKNVRELEGALNRVLAYTELKQKVPSAKEVETLLDEISRPRNKNITFKQITKAVLEFYGLNESEVLRKSRSKTIVRPRQIIMYLLRDILKMSYPAIGEKIGGKDHTTVIHACEKIEKELAYDTQFAQDLNLIRERILGAE